MGVYKPFTVTGGHFRVGLFLTVAGRNQKKVHWSQLVAAASYFLLVLFLFLVGLPPMFRLVKCSKRSALFLTGKHMQICFPVTPPILNISIIYKCLYRWVYMLQMEHNSIARSKWLNPLDISKLINHQLNRPKNCAFRCERRDQGKAQRPVVLQFPRSALPSPLDPDLQQFILIKLQEYRCIQCC